MSGIPDIEDIQGCASSYVGSDGGAGWVQETNCGHTPDVRVPSERSQYYQDPDNLENYHLYAFGILTDVNPTFNPTLGTTRGIGSKDIQCSKYTKFESTLEIGYNPVNLARVPFWSGITQDIQALEAPVCVQDCLPYTSAEIFHSKECPSDKAARFLFNMLHVSTFSSEVSIGEFVKWNESMMGQYRQQSDSKTYIPPIQSVEVGLDPLEPCCEAFMAYEGNIYKTKRETETLTGQIQAGGTYMFELTYNAMDFNMDGVIDGHKGLFQNKKCFRDIEIYVDGELINSDLIDVSTINSKYFQLCNEFDGDGDCTSGHLILPGQSIVARYYRMVQMPNIIDYNFEINHNTVESRGIWKGLPVPYEVMNVIRGYSGSMTSNFKDLSEADQMIDDEFFHLYYEQGGNGATPIVFIFVLVKWENVNPPQAESDVIALPLPWIATHLCLDNQIRLPPNITIEEEEGAFI